MARGQLPYCLAKTLSGAAFQAAAELLLGAIKSVCLDAPARGPAYLSVVFNLNITMPAAAPISAPAADIV
jgi:hypothetical protein